MRKSFSLDRQSAPSVSGFSTFTTCEKKGVLVSMAVQSLVDYYDVKLAKTIIKFNAAGFEYPQSGTSIARYTAGIISIQIRPDLKNPDTMIFVTIRFTEPGMELNYARHVKVVLSSQPHSGREFNRLGVARLPYVNHRTDHVRLIHTPNRPLRAS